MLPILGANPATVGTIGSIAKGVGAFAAKFAGPLLNFAGGLFGDGGDKSNLDRHFIARRVRDAQEAGIHPLYALGAGGGYSPAVSTGSSVGDALRSTGSLFDNIRAESQAKSAAGMSDRIAEAQIRSLNASAFRDETQAQVALAQAALDAQSFQAQQRDAIGTRLDQAIANSPEVFGIPELPLARATRRVVLPNGEIVRIADQNLMETGELLGNAATLAGSDKWLMSKVTEIDQYLRNKITAPIKGAATSTKKEFLKWWRKATAPRRNRSNPQYQHRR